MQFIFEELTPIGQTKRISLKNGPKCGKHMRIHGMLQLAALKKELS